MGEYPEPSPEMVGYRDGAPHQNRSQAHDFSNRVWPAKLHAYTALYQATCGRSVGNKCTYDEFNQSTLRMIGHLHPLLVHMPVGILLLALFFRIMAWRRAAFWEESLPAILIIGLFTCLLSIGSGWFLANEGGYEADQVESHKYWGIGLTVGTLVLLVLLTKFYASKLEYIAWPLMALALTITGHKGGSLTHGEDYLNFFVKEYQAPVVENVEEAAMYSDVIEPILAAKCWSCHSSKKQKGGLRLDSPEAIKKGGENGIILTAGHPEKSTLYERLLLAKADDEHMPPDGKPQLSPSEIKVLEWWIKSGLPYEEKVKDLKPDAAMLAALKAVSSRDLNSSLSYLPEGEAVAVNEVIIKELKASGIFVSRVSAQSNFLTVTVLNPAVSDTAIARLEEVKSAIVWLKIVDRVLTMNNLEMISGMRNLVKLELRNCQIAGEDMSFLRNLKELKILNLQGSQMSILHAADLRNMSKLESVYVFGTAFDRKELLQMHAQFPSLKIDTGGYKVPTLKSDTTVFKREDLISLTQNL